MLRTDAARLVPPPATYASTIVEYRTTRPRWSINVWIIGTCTSLMATHRSPRSQEPVLVEDRWLRVGGDPGRRLAARAASSSGTGGQCTQSSRSSTGVGGRRRHRG